VKFPLKLDGIRSPLRFEETVRQAIHDFKYRNLRALALPLAQILSEYLCDNPMPADALVPVPLHSHRLRERGYNQSALLARELARLTGLPLIDGELIRFRDSGAQVMASSVSTRWSNVAGAFGCRDEKIYGKRILLIDDVCTTGATLDSCSVALKAAGAVSVWGLTVAREV
jgi:ComF family protein